MKSEKINIAFGLTDESGGYYKNIATVMVEIFTHTHADIHIHIFHDNTLGIKKNILLNLIKRFKGEASFYDLTHEKELECVGHLAMNKGMLYRLFIPKYCIDAKKMIYLDGDVLVMGDIRELWNQDIGSYDMAAVKDLGYTREIYVNTIYYKRIGIQTDKYFNSGVLLLNLDKIREKMNLIEEFMNFSLKNHFCKMLDQDFLNYEFQKKVLFLPKYYNYMASDVDEIDETIASKQLIIHFAGPFKPWNCKNPFIIRYFCMNLFQVENNNDERIYNIIDYMSKLPQINFDRLGLKHSLLKQNKDRALSIACIMRGLMPAKLYNKVAYFIMFRLKMKFLYSFYYVYIK